MFNQCPICFNETTVCYEDKGQKVCPDCFVKTFGSSASGNWNHQGRPGEVGGSGEGGVGVETKVPEEAKLTPKDVQVLKWKIEREGTPGLVEVLHGTTPEAAKKIVQEGIRSNKYHNFGDSFYNPSEGRANKVFVTTSMEYAKFFGASAVGQKTVGGGKLPKQNPYVVITARVPEDYFIKNALHDVHTSNQDWNYILPEVKKEWIVDVEENDDVRVFVEKAGLTIYVPMSKSLFESIK